MQQLHGGLPELRTARRIVDSHDVPYVFLPSRLQYSGESTAVDVLHMCRLVVPRTGAQ